MLEYIGWVGVGFALLAGPSQLIKLLRTKQTAGISKWEYIYLDVALVCYLLHAIHIHANVFIVSNALSLGVISTLLYLILKYRRQERRLK